MPTYINLPAPSDHFKGKWYRQLIEDLQLAGKARRTVYGYVRAVRKLADFCQQSPHMIDESDLRGFLLHQIVERQVAAGTQSVLLSGIKFFFRSTCPRDWDVLENTKLNYIKSLPEVITQPQVFQIIDACRTRRMKTFIWTTYTLGLRIGEAVHLQVGDLDSQRMMVHKYLAPYVYRIAITNHRIVSVTDDEVVYKVKPSGKRCYHRRKLSGERFVRALAQHILPPGFQKVRYYGFMSPNNKLQLEDVRWLIWRWLGWTYWLGSGRFQPPPPQPKPPKCDHCGGELELIGMTHPDHRLVWSKSLTQRGPPCD